MTDTESPHTSPVLLIMKKTADSRMIVDYRVLNRQTEQIIFSLDDYLALLFTLANSTMFIVSDLGHGYFQVSLT